MGYLYHGLASEYLTDMLNPYKPVHSLRSMGGTLLTVPRSRLWKNLPVEIRLAESVNSFKSLLKTHFYRLAFT